MAKPEHVFHMHPEAEKMYGFAATVRAGNTLYLSGIISMDDQFQILHEGDMAGQIRAIYEIMKETLAHHGLTMANVVRETNFVTDMDAFMAPEANETRLGYYKDCAPPSATLVQVVRLAIPGALLECEAIAVFDD